MLKRIVVIAIMLAVLAPQAQALNRKLAILRATRSFSSLCPVVRNLVGGEIWKSKASDHLSSGDPRKNSTSLIFMRGNARPRFSCLGVYDKKGNLVHKLGSYSPPGSAYAARYYGGWGCGDKKSPGSVATTAQRNTKSKTVYVKAGDRTCIAIPDPNQCYNSSSC